MIDLDAIEARAKAATPGPWRVNPRVEADPGETDGHGWLAGPPAAIEYEAALFNRDADFIAAAREDVPALIAEVRRLRSVVDMYRAHAAHPREPK